MHPVYSIDGIDCMTLFVMQSGPPPPALSLSLPLSPSFSLSTDGWNDCKWSLEAGALHDRGARVTTCVVCTSFLGGQQSLNGLKPTIRDLIKCTRYD